MPRPDKIQLKDKHGRIMVEMETPESIVATAATVGLTRAVFIKHEAKQYTGYVQKSVLDELNVSTVQIPANFAGLEAIDTPTRLMDQLFEIYDVDEQDEYVEISARHIFYRNLKNYTLWKPTEDTEYTAAAVMRNVMSNAMFESDFDVASDCTDTKPGTEFDYERKNLVECFLDPENGICAKFGLSLIRDNTFFYCLKEVGYDRGYLIESGKNLIGVDRHENLDGVATRVAAFGKDKKGDIVWMNHNGLKFIDSQYIDTYSTPMLEIYDTGLQIGKDDVTADNIQEKLLEAAQKRFDEDEVDLPEVTMTINFVSLGDTEEFAQYRGLDKVYLYDILTIRDAKRGYNYSAQVIGVEHDVLTGRLISVTIGSIKNADASRKIATWQVPEVDGRNIRLLSIQAGMFEPGAIGSADLQENIIQYAHFASATIDSLTTDALEAAQAHIHELIAGSITADDIQAGSITTVTLAAEAVTAAKIAAGAVTAEKVGANAITAGKIASGSITTEKLATNSVTATKIDAGAVTAEKIAAGAITATKIDATDISAINAKLGTADIAQAEIQSADIDYAQIKDLHAGSAYLDQAVFQEAVGGKLYVPRLSVGYAQMVGATIGDLVIQASNGDFYGIDVDLAGNVTATRRTVSAGEIAAGHTTDGRTLVLGTDILATDLNTENIYASHALMNEISAASISVDELWARTAFINKLMTTDISSNTYIQATIGNWDQGSTITQEIDSIRTRITELGYGTIYFGPDEPSHSELVEGDIWVQSTSTGTWNSVKTDYATWATIRDTIGTWQTVGGIPKVWVWDGRFWQEMYDSLLPQTLQTEIEQLSDAINLRATKAEVDLLSGEVTEFAAELSIQAQEIQSAVSAVNLKAASYVMPVDPRTAYVVSVGDVWIKTDDTATWNAVKSKNATWNEVKTKYDAWMRLIGSVTYVWDGSKWVETSDRATEIYQKTLIDQTINQITLMAEASAQLGDELIRTRAELQVTNSSILAEVERATTAENTKIAKTSQYADADSIVQAAQTYVNGILTSKSAIEQTATGITAYVEEYTGDNYYSIKSGIDIKAAGVEISGAKYIKIKSGGKFLVDSGNFSISEAGAVTVKGSVTSTSGKIGGWTLATNRLYSGSGTGYVGLDSSASGTYAIWAGNSDPASAKFWVKRTGEAYFEGAIKAAANSTLGGWTLGSNNLHSGSGESYVCLASSGTYSIYAGSSTASSAPFRVKRNGEVTLTKLMVQKEDGTEMEFNPFSKTYGLWKLDYSTIKRWSVSGGTVTIETTGGNINFNSAAGVVLSGGWTDGWTKYTVTAKDGAGNIIGTKSSGAVSLMLNGATATRATVKKALEDSNTHTTLISAEADGEDIAVLTIDASGVYAQGKTDGIAGVTLTGTWTDNWTKYTVTAKDGDGNVIDTQSSGAVSLMNGSVAATRANVKKSLEDSTTHTVLLSVEADSEDIAVLTVDASGVYEQGESAGVAGVTLTGTWTNNWTRYTVTAKDANGNTIGTKSSGTVTADKTNAQIKSAIEAADNHSTTLTIEADGEDILVRTINASGVYTQGANSVTVTSVTLGSWVSGNQYNCTVALSSGNKASTINCASAINRGWDNARANVRMPSAGTSTSFTVRTPNEARTGADTHTFTVTKATPSADGGYANVRYNNATVARISLNDWWEGGYEAGLAEGGYNDGWDDARSNVSMPSAGTGTSFTVQIPNSARTGSESRTFTITKGTPSESGGYASVLYNNTRVARISLDDWWDAGYAAGLEAGGYSEGYSAGLSDYYSSQYWAKATAQNNWIPQIPNETNTGSEGWVNSGASDAFEAGKNGVTVTRVTLGSLITGTQYNCSVLLSSGLTRAGTINCATAYSDARSGYTPGIYTQYSGAQLYTIGQSGPEKYTGTLYVKS